MLKEAPSMLSWKQYIVLITVLDMPCLKKPWQNLKSVKNLIKKLYGSERLNLFTKSKINQNQPGRKIAHPCSRIWMTRLTLYKLVLQVKLVLWNERLISEKRTKGWVEPERRHFQQLNTGCHTRSHLCSAFPELSWIWPIENTQSDTSSPGFDEWI